MKELTAKEYLGLKSLEKRLKHFFYRYHLPGSFEDFLNSYHEDYLRGVAQNQDLRYYAIDYLRRSIGRSGQKIEFNKKFSLEDYEEPIALDCFETFESFDLIGRMQGKIRVIVGLRVLHNLTLDEIGFLFDVTESRISRFIIDILDRPFKDLPFREDKFLCSKYSMLQRTEEAARLIGVPTKWLRDQLSKYDSESHAKE